MYIFVDMDQVLVDFHKGVQDLLGHHFNLVDHDPVLAYMRNSAIGHHQTFWENLPPMPDYLTLWNRVKVLNPILLTATPNWADHHVIDGKRKWAFKHLGLPPGQVAIVKKRDKARYANLYGIHGVSLLIDDDRENIDRFVRAGGLGILHKNAHTTIIELEDILNR